MTRASDVWAYGYRALGLGAALALLATTTVSRAEPPEAPTPTDEPASTKKAKDDSPVDDEAADDDAVDDDAADDDAADEDAANEETPAEAADEVEPAPTSNVLRDKRAPREEAQAEKTNGDVVSWYTSPAYACRGCTNGGKRHPDALERVPYHPSMTVPDGYHLESTPRYGLIAAGASITTTLWAVSLVSAIALDSEQAQDGDPNFDDMYWPMFIPVVGPFAAIGTADSSGTGAAILALDGTLQAAGLAMVIAGFAAPTVEIVENYKLEITPTISKEDKGVSLSGSF